LNRNNHLIAVYTARGEAEANLIKGKLESFGIQSMFKWELSPSVYAFAGDDIGKFTIFVKEEDAEDARDLLKGEQDA
jgi:hypothetical protein